MGRTGHLLTTRDRQLSPDSLLRSSEHDELEQRLTLLEEDLVVETERQVESLAERSNGRESEDLGSEEVEQCPD